MSDWAKQWSEAVAPISGKWTYQKSSEELRKLIKTGLLRFTDLTNNPARFFEAHRLVVDPVKRGPGFWIRFTVQYNLFAGTVVGLGGPAQVKALDDYQEKGQLGCFALTERLAGVNSGLVVETTATWIPDKQMFCLNTPTEGATKNWISQGLTADKAVVVADLIIDGKHLGPHGFIMDMRQNGQLVKGVEIGDMGGKTTGNDLDNAWIKYHQVMLPKSALLDKYCKIEDNKYVQTTNERMRIEVIGQRLLTGRVAVGQASMQFARMLYAKTKEYSDRKKCWSPGSRPALSDIPQLRSLYEEAEERMTKLDNFMTSTEKELNILLQQDSIPPVGLVQDIAVAKVRGVEEAIELCFRLKQEVGSYALMADTGFDNTDFLQCCKFAEGDSRILMQKMARDAVKAYKKGDKTGVEKEDSLAKDLADGGKENWDKNWRKVFGLAEAAMQRKISSRL